MTNAEGRADGSRARSRLVEGALREARKPYAEALLASHAGKIELERGEKASTVKRYLQETAKEHGLRIRSTWTVGKEQVLLWKKVRS